MISFDIWIAFWVFVIGLCIGSFLNVVALRGLKNESIVFPASHCPKCENKLKWWMNIPVLSYIFLRGKCHYCKCPISLQYPVVEFITGVLFLICFIKFGYTIQTVFYACAFSVLIAMSVCDLKESVILDYHAYILVGLGLLYNLISGNILFGLIGAVFGFILYEILAHITYPFIKTRAYGEGDSLIAAGMGAFLGWKLLILSAVLSILIMSISSLPYFLYYSYKKGKIKTVCAVGVAFLLILSAIVVNVFDLIKSSFLAIFYVSFLITGVILSIKMLFSEIDTNSDEENKGMLALPFGPSMALSFILLIFFQIPFVNYTKAYLEPISSLIKSFM